MVVGQNNSNNKGNQSCSTNTVIKSSVPELEAGAILAEFIRNPDNMVAGETQKTSALMMENLQLFSGSNKRQSRALAKT